MINQLNFFQIVFLYSPVLSLCFVYQIKDKFKPSGIDSIPHSFSIISAIISMALLFTVILIQSFWYHFSFIGIPYSDIAFELFATIWFGMTLSLIIMLSRRFNFSIYKVINFKISISYPIIVIGLIYIIFIALLSQDPDFIDDISNDNMPPLHSIQRSLLLVFPFNAILLGPFVEEVVFRGLLFYPLYRKVGKRAAIIFTAYFFMHYHFFILLYDLTSSIFIFTAGIALTWLYEKKKSLIYPLACHMLYNATSVYFKFIALR